MGTVVDDLTAAMALAHHLGRGKYISGLAAFPLEDLAVNKTNEVLDRLDHEGRRAACRTARVASRVPATLGSDSCRAGILPQAIPGENRNGRRRQPGRGDTQGVWISDARERFAA